MPRTRLDDIPVEGRITAIKPLPSDPNIRRIYVDGKSIARLPIADIAALELTEDQDWTEALAAAVTERIITQKARKTALSMLGRRGYSRGELTQRLVRKEYKKSTAEAIVAELAEDGWIDEEAYAQSIARETLARKPAGRRFIIQKLLSRQIDHALAERVVQDLLNDYDLTEEAMKLAESKLKTVSHLDPDVAYRRIAGTLHRRGFESSVIYTVMNELKIQSPE